MLQKYAFNEYFKTSKKTMSFLNLEYTKDAISKCTYVNNIHHTLTLVSRRVGREYGSPFAISIYLNNKAVLLENAFNYYIEFYRHRKSYCKRGSLSLSLLHVLIIF